MSREQDFRREVVASVLTPRLRAFARIEPDVPERWLHRITSSEPLGDEPDTQIAMEVMGALEAICWWSWGIREGYLSNADAEAAPPIISAAPKLRELARRYSPMVGIDGVRLPQVPARGYVEMLLESVYAANDGLEERTRLVCFSLDPEWVSRLDDVALFVDVLDERPDAVLNGDAIDRISWAFLGTPSSSAGYSVEWNFHYHTPSSWPALWHLQSAQFDAGIQINPALLERVGRRNEQIEALRAKLAGVAARLTSNEIVAAMGSAIASLNIDQIRSIVPLERVGDSYAALRQWLLRGPDEDSFLPFGP